ncbi:MAG TPA: CHAT domain-containing protein [Thermoanaerobaculia bacterium]|nr:CHAT domain-containing protein [Thermoanaerobaculia bacterium]
MEAARSIELTARRQPSAQAAADLAALRLIAHRPRAAARLLEDALQSHPASSSLATDLSAVYLELARLERDPYLLLKALALADRASTAASPPLEAVFNRALALEKLAPASVASAAWASYLARDQDSPWASEARRRAAALHRAMPTVLWDQNRPVLEAAAAAGDVGTASRLCRDLRQRARQYAEEELLTQWADGAGAQRSSVAAPALAKARSIGAALAAITGDLMLRDAVAAIDECSTGTRSPPRTARASLTGPSSLDRCDDLVRGHRQFGRGLSSYQDRRFTAARHLLATAEPLLQRAHSPFSRWAAFYLAVCDYQRADYTSAKQRLARLRGLPDAVRYLNLLGRVHWMDGLIAVVQGRLTESLSSYDAAASRFLATGEQENLAAVFDLLAQNYSALGDERSAWRFRLAALAKVDAFADSRRRYNILKDFAEAVAEAGAPATGLAFQDEVIAMARSLRRPDVLALALRRRAAMLASLQRLDLARKDLEEARDQLRLAADPEVRRDVQGEILTVQGEMELASQPAAAVGSLTAALSIYTETHYYLDLSKLYLERSRALGALGRRAEAEADLGAAVSSLERQSREMGTSALRSLFLDQGRRLFDEAVSFYAGQGRAAAAFDVAERARAQLLLALACRDGRPPGERSALAQGRTIGAMTAAQIAARLPPDVLLVEYAVLPSRLLAWSISDRGVRFVTVQLAETELTALVQHLVAAAESEPAEGATPSSGSSGAFPAAARRAFDLLIRPFLSDLAGRAALIVVPDKTLYRVPFAALVDRSTGEPLVGRAALGVAPSATMYLMLRERFAALSSTPLRLAAVLGNPTLASPGQPGLGDTRAAQDEAITVASLYPGARLLLGSSANRTAFLAAAADADVIHVAAHALVSDEVRESYGIVFAGEQVSQPPLRVEDLDPRHARLIFLSACRTARGFLSPSEGALSPARVVLGAGIPAVVATLWDIDDEGASRLAVLFHRRLRAGEGVLQALRGAELTLWRRGEPPAVWAAFEVLGGAI